MVSGNLDQGKGVDHFNMPGKNFTHDSAVRVVMKVLQGARNKRCTEQVEVEGGLIQVLCIM